MHLVSSSSMYSEVEHNNISDMILLIYQNHLRQQWGNVNNYNVSPTIFCYFPYNIILFLIFGKDYFVSSFSLFCNGMFTVGIFIEM